MYIPPAFKIDDPATLRSFIEQNSFATVITSSPTGLFASHVPLLPNATQGRPLCLSGHLALSNPQWRDLEKNQEVLCIFQGPHSYISPAWYKTTPAVPTWNYAAVHAYGRPSLIRDPDALSRILDETIQRYEGAGADRYRQNLPPEYRANMTRGIIGFQIEIVRLEGKFKLGQNRGPEDVIGVYRQLQSSPDPDARKLAALMRDQGICGDEPTPSA